MTVLVRTPGSDPSFGVLYDGNAVEGLATAVSGLKKVFLNRPTNRFLDQKTVGKTALTCLAAGVVLGDAYGGNIIILGGRRRTSNRE